MQQDSIAFELQLNLHVGSPSCEGPPIRNFKISTMKSLHLESFVNNHLS